MEYILENPLNSKCTIFTEVSKNEYGEPTYSKEVVSCAIFEGLQRLIKTEGREVISNTTIGVKKEVNPNGMVYLGETTSLTPPYGCYEIQKVYIARDTEQNIEGYWIWL